GTSDTADLGLPTQLALGPHLASDAGDLGGERVELIHHRVDGVLQLENLTLHVDGNLLGQVPVCYSGGDCRDVPNLSRQVTGHRVDRVGQVLPGPGHAADLGLATELALRPDLASDAGDLGGHAVELVNHGVDDLARSQELTLEWSAVDLERHALR